ncbi:argonaute/piwi family protein [Gimesia aquarii]|uniref:Protein argonaute n=1 Tax=Gimesia aquarii TaxID=2527964 RepID=A0A517WXV3_9PLAN|nr:hypothetical protein [Gimesia aquarii]QDU10090.1 hypothetical protein V202x_34890 [Gimesia aquarii]
MKVLKLGEPELEFGTNSHIDIRFGIMNYCPLDFESDNAAKTIRVGIVGSACSIEGIRDWIEKCRHEIPAKDSRQSNLFPRFPGFNPDLAFHSELTTDSSLERQLSSSKINSVVKIPVLDELRIEAVRSIVEEVNFLLEKKPPDVIICAIPQEYVEVLDPDTGKKDLDDETLVSKTIQKSKINFHHLLKARCMSLPRACPIQIVLPSTYDSSKRRRSNSLKRQVQPIQDEATRAWNLHTALYYKAGGIPWRLKYDPSKLQTCFVGIGFFHSLDKENISTSVAQVFNERGSGLVVRGGPAMISKEDRQVHLDADSAYALMLDALKQYQNEHHTIPARVVIHKSSSHSSAEIDGFQKAAEEYRVHSCELLSLRKSLTRLFRNSEYPPLRGTFLTLNNDIHILYTRGSVEFYSTYPGMYMPRTLRINCDKVDQTPRYLSEEILALTKMNWNNTQFDNGVPITLRAARQVGDILKYINHTDSFQPHYSFYM